MMPSLNETRSSGETENEAANNLCASYQKIKIDLPNPVATKPS